MILSRVDLPQPLDPITAEKAPLRSVSETPCSAVTLLRA